MNNNDFENDYSKQNIHVQNYDDNLKLDTSPNLQISTNKKDNNINKRNIVIILIVILSIILFGLIGYVLYDMLYDNSNKDEKEVNIKSQYVSIDSNKNQYLTLFDNNNFELKYFLNDEYYIKTGAYKINKKNIELNNVGIAKIYNKYAQIHVNAQNNKINKDYIYIDNNYYSEFKNKLKKSLDTYIRNYKRNNSQLLSLNKIEVNNMDSCIKKNNNIYCYMDYLIYLNDYDKTLCDNYNYSILDYISPAGTCKTDYIQNNGWVNIDENNYYKIIKIESSF